MKHKIIILSLALVLVFSLTMSATASPKVIVNNQQLNVLTIIENGTTLVPLRTIFQALGANVDWDGDTQTVTATKGHITVRLQIGSKTAYCNGQPVSLQVPGKVVNGSTMVPLRFVSEALGANVNWISTTQTIAITSGFQNRPLLNNALEPSKIYEICSPAIVLINAYDKDNNFLCCGSGIIVDSGGKVVTNYHVIDGAHKANVKLMNGKEFTVSKVLSYDINRDVAILLINGKNLPVVNLGDSDKIANGQKILTISSPYGLENTITDGLISHKNRKINDLSIMDPRF